jgi:hypothetical protein
VFAIVVVAIVVNLLVELVDCKAGFTWCNTILQAKLIHRISTANTFLLPDNSKQMDLPTSLQSRQDAQEAMLGLHSVYPVNSKKKKIR